ncbi:MAG TPA: DNA methyltransferase, partial [Candidatus Angelobacter sp.]
MIHQPIQAKIGTLPQESSSMPERTSLYYGDNLTVLRDPTYIAAESVDLVYLDPPFKSDQDFNVLYEEKDGTLSESQMRSFQDTWHYDKKAQELYEETVNFGPEKVATTLEALMSCLGRSDMMAYLVNMAPRLSELRTKLKSTGSLYLHCDPSASHYLKMVLDSVFGPAQFRNEIVWRRTGAHSNPRRFGGIHDTLLFYSKTDEYYFKPLPQPYMKGHVEKRYRKDETGKLKFI